MSRFKHEAANRDERLRRDESAYSLPGIRSLDLGAWPSQEGRVKRNGGKWLCSICLEYKVKSKADHKKECKGWKR